MSGMDIDFLALITRIVVGAAVAACIGLFVRLRKVETGRAVADKRLDTLEGRNGDTGAIAELRERLETIHREFHDYRLCAVEHYVRRDDYVPQTSLILSKLDAQQALLARLDERSRQWEVSR